MIWYAYYTPCSSEAWCLVETLPHSLLSYLQSNISCVFVWERNKEMGVVGVPLCCCFSSVKPLPHTDLHLLHSHVRTYTSVHVCLKVCALALSLKLCVWGGDCVSEQSCLSFVVWSLISSSDRKKLQYVASLQQCQEQSRKLRAAIKEFKL